MAAGFPESDSKKRQLLHMQLASDERAASGRQALCSRPVLPYAIFFLILATSICTQYFPKLAHRSVLVTNVINLYHMIFHDIKKPFFN